MLLRYK